MLNLSFVKTFVTLAETGSFSDTAQRLAIAQPTVSQQIKRLESDLGVALFHRSNVACEPTFHGRSILPYARSLLASADRLRAAADGDFIRIGCSGNIATYYVSRDLKAFVDAGVRPFRWDIHAATNPELADRLIHGEIDIAMMEWPDPRPGLDVRPWRQEALVVIVSPDHKLARQRSISVDRLFDLELIGGERGSGTGSILRAALGKRAEDLRISHNLHSTEAVKAAVRAGLGASIVLKGAVENEVTTGQLSMLTVRRLRLEKVFYVALLEDLPPQALPSQLANFLSRA